MCPVPLQQGCIQVNRHLKYPQAAIKKKPADHKADGLAGQCRVNQLTGCFTPT